MLHAYAGDADAAGRTWGEMLALGAEMGISPRVGDFRRATIDRALDDPEASLATARRSEATFAATGETGQRSTVVAVAGQACLVLGDDDEAMRYADESRRLAAGDDAVSQILWRAVAGVVHARRGEHATADRLTLESIAIAGPTDAIAAADAWLARAETLALAGRAGESADAARTARALYAAKGFVNAVRWAERWAAEAAGGR